MERPPSPASQSLLSMVLCLPAILVCAPFPGYASVGLSPPSLSFAGQAGGANPLPGTTNVGLIPGVSINGAANWSVTVSTSSGGNWLSASPGSWPSIAQTFTVTASVNLAGLTPGTYTGAVTVSQPNYGTAVAVVTLQVSRACYAFSPPNLHFTGVIGGSNPPPQTTQLYNACGGSPLGSWKVISRTSGDNGTCLTVSPTSGAGSTTLTVSLNINDAPCVAFISRLPGTSVLFGLGDGSPPFASLGVDWGIGQPANLAWDPLSLTFVGHVEGVNPPPQKIRLYSPNGVPFLKWNVISGPPGVTWFSVSPASGSGTSTLTVSVNLAGLKEGTYMGTLNGQGEAGGLNAVAFVTLRVVSAFALAMFPPALGFASPPGGAPLAQSVTVSDPLDGSPGNWTSTVVTSDGLPWLFASPSSLSGSGPISVSVNTGGLKNGTYHGVVSVTASGLPSGTPDVTAVAPITLQLGPGPAIFDGGIVPVFSFLPVIQPGSWFSIYGANLASATAVWNGDFPTSLGRVTVTVNGKTAYLWYVSPGQINLQAPDDTTRGAVTVTVTSANGTASSSVGLSDSSPSLSLFDATYVAGVILTPDGSGAYGNGTYDLLGPTGHFSFKTRAVKAGETLELFGVGFGPTTPTVAAGKSFSGAARTANPVVITIGGLAAQVLFSGITSSGVYQFNVVVPPTASGDQLLQATLGGLQTPANVYITIQ